MAKSIDGTEMPVGRIREVPVIEAARLVVLLTVALAAIFVLMALPAVKAAPHNVPIGIAGPPSAAAAVTHALATVAPGGFKVTTYPDEQSLAKAARSRTIYGGFILDPANPTVLLASGGSPAVAQALVAIGTELAGKAGARLSKLDVAPLPASDPRGVGLGVAGLPIAIGGIIPAVLLTRRFAGRVWLNVVTATVFALIAGVALTTILYFWFGSIDANFWLVSLGLSLGMAAVSLTILGLESIAGYIGLGAGAALMMLVGNPLSGLTTSPHFLPGGWSRLGQLLPLGANGTLLRSDAFFGGAGGLAPALTLLAWLALGILLSALSARKPWRPKIESH